VSDDDTGAVGAHLPPRTEGDKQNHGTPEINKPIGEKAVQISRPRYFRVHRAGERGTTPKLSGGFWVVFPLRSRDFHLSDWSDDSAPETWAARNRRNIAATLFGYYGTADRSNRFTLHRSRL
jgi:hypothetical protein